MNTLLNKLNSGDTLVAGSGVYRKQDMATLKQKMKRKRKPFGIK
jgi:hypothetical protein